MNPTAVLNPLQQRLFLYGFAYIKIDPFFPIDPEQWGQGSLQYLPASSRKASWRHLFCYCDLYQSHRASPVVSPSLKGLLELRRLFPRRPLIFCRTAFEPEPKSGALRRLWGPRGWLPRLLHAEDGIEPLHWLAKRDYGPFCPVRAYERFPMHPLGMLWRRLKNRRPHSAFTIQEDGLIAEQPDLFHPQKRFEVPAGFERSRTQLDASLREQLESLRGRYRVFAQNREMLEWFRRDCVRLLGCRFRCRPFPYVPDPADPHTHFVLVPDSRLRFQRLSRGWGSLHLDGDRMRRYFREYRLSDSGAPSWWAESPVTARAQWRSSAGVLTFFKCRKAWRSWDGRDLAVADRGEEFARRAAAIRALFAGA